MYVSNKNNLNRRNSFETRRTLPDLGVHQLVSRSTRGLNTTDNEVINSDKPQHFLLSQKLSSSLPHNETMLTGRSSVANDGRPNFNYQIQSVPRFLENEAPVSNQTNYWQTEVPRDIEPELHSRRYREGPLLIQN